MTRKESTIIALKCYAIYIIVQLIVSLPILVGICLKLGRFGQHDTSAFFIASISFLSVVFCLATAFFLWKLANSLLIKETMPEPVSGEIGVDEVMKIILTCMGVYFAINAVIAFPSAFVDFQISRSNVDYQPLVSVVSLASVVLQIIFGCLLIAKPAKWVKKIRAIREK